MILIMERPFVVASLLKTRISRSCIYLLRAANQSNSMISLIEGGHRLREQLWCGIYHCEVSYGVRLVESAIGLILLE